MFIRFGGVIKQTRWRVSLLTFTLLLIATCSAFATTASISPYYEEVRAGNRGSFYTSWSGGTPYISVRFSDGYRGGFSYSYTSVSSLQTSPLYSRTGDYYPSLDVTDINHESGSAEATAHVY